MEFNDKQLEILERYFGYMELYEKDNLFLETYTNGGVDMIIYLDANKNIIENLEEYINNFDMDEEIEMYRQDKTYKNSFTISESVDDFREWERYIRRIIKLLKKANK